MIVTALTVTVVVLSWALAALVALILHRERQYTELATRAERLATFRAQIEADIRPLGGDIATDGAPQPPAEPRVIDARGLARRPGVRGPGAQGREHRDGSTS